MMRGINDALIDLYDLVDAMQHALGEDGRAEVFGKLAKDFKQQADLMVLLVKLLADIEAKYLWSESAEFWNRLPEHHQDVIKVMAQRREAKEAYDSNP